MPATLGVTAWLPQRRSRPLLHMDAPAQTAARSEVGRLRGRLVYVRAVQSLAPLAYQTTTRKTAMKLASFALAATLLAGTALAQTAPVTPTPGNNSPSTSVRPTPGVSSSTGTTPETGIVGRNTGTAAASGNRNQAVATTGDDAMEPSSGASSFTEGQARSRIEDKGFTAVTGLTKDDNGVWRGTATKAGSSTQVWMDYKGNVGQQGGMRPKAATSTTTGATGTNPPGTAAGRAADRALGTNTTGANPAARNADGTTGNPPGTAAGRAADRALGTNTTGANPAARNADGTTGNPPGTAAGRAADRALGTNTTGANPAANAPDGTPGNPAGTAAGRAIDRNLGTNTTGTNPSGTTGTTR